MTGPSPSEVSQLLRTWNEGDERAREKLMPIVNDELHRMARQYMAHESPGHTLQTTALVNEAYLRLVDSGHTTWQNRIHFFAVCAQAMRRILVDWARSRQASKRGGDIQPLRLDEALDEAEAPDVDLVALDEALSLLRQGIDHGLSPSVALDMEKDPELKSLHGDPRFVALVAYAKKRAAQPKRQNRHETRRRTSPVI